MEASALYMAALLGRCSSEHLSLSEPDELLLQVSAPFPPHLPALLSSSSSGYTSAGSINV